MKDSTIVTDPDEIFYIFDIQRGNRSTCHIGLDLDGENFIGLCGKVSDDNNNTTYSEIDEEEGFPEILLKYVEDEAELFSEPEEDVDGTIYPPLKVSACKKCLRLSKKIKVEDRHTRFITGLPDCCAVAIGQDKSRRYEHIHSNSGKAILVDPGSFIPPMEY